MLDNESNRKGLAMKKAIFRATLGLGLVFVAQSALATQSVFPALDAAGTNFTANGANSWSIARSGSSSLVLFGRYTSTSANESGLGLKIQYDATKVTNVVIDQVQTKCMVFTPDVTVNGASSQVLFGWADTSQRANGAVGWPDSADGTPPCINPAPPAAAIATTTAAFPAPTTLFRMTATMVAGFTTGNTTTISFSAPSVSSAGATPGFTNTSLVVNGAAAPACNLDVDGNGSRQAFVDGIIIVRYLLGNTGAGLTAGLTIPGPNNTSALLTPVLSASSYDIDNSGAQQAFVDGVILVRLMLGTPDASLLNGITLPGTSPFTTAAQIRANVNTKCGTSF